MENLNDVEDYLNTEIVCTLAGLGYSEGSEYYKSPDCLGRFDILRAIARLIEYYMKRAVKAGGLIQRCC